LASGQAQGPRITGVGGGLSLGAPDNDRVLLHPPPQRTTTSEPLS
jgi:hypothetical protein